ncbi:LPS assembly protein LptD [bacterium]|nr:LPS assembly protein LptD [bacterium]MBU1958006.1 LPS assembly protein LptD [bacterium]
MRSFLLLSCFSTLIFANETIEVFAKEVTATVDHFNATGDVVILYDGALIKSKKATYDKNTSLLKLEGDVEMLGGEENTASSDQLLIDTSKKSVEFNKLFLTTQDDLWIDASKATKIKEDYQIFNSRLSSCNQMDPDWTIEFTEAHYHKDKNFITLDDAELIFFNKKVFYFPFIAFPTIEKRKSGLLFPQFKFSSIEGFSYEQPYFYVPKDNIDVEFNPQFRTNRGVGGHISTRFVDSNHSSGSFTTGYFKNSDSYANENNLHNEHYGFEFLYKSTGFLPQSIFFDNFDSGLYVNATYLNDLEYLNLQKDTAASLVSSNLIESRLNAFVYDEKNHLGLYSKYYIDTSKESNTNTLQELPTLHYHNYMTYLISDKLFYTFDARLHNYTRQSGSRAYQAELDLPITYYDSFFNDYLDFSLSENLYLSRVTFSNLDYKSDDYRYYRNFHTMELSSDLTKQYGNNVHTLHPSIVYTKPSFETEEPLEYADLNEDQQELFVTQTKKEKISLGLSQYYYNQELEMNLFHRLAWIQFPNERVNQGDINNEMGYDGEYLNLYSNLFYSLDEDQIHSLTTSLSYNQSNYDIMLTHFYNYDFMLNKEKTSFVNTAFIHNYNKHNQWFFNYDYDLEKLFNHQWHVGWAHKQKCWGAKVSVGQERIPNIDDSFKNTMLYFELNLNPLGGISQNIEQEFSSQGS